MGGARISSLVGMSVPTSRCFSWRVLPLFFFRMLISCTMLRLAVPATTAALRSPPRLLERARSS